MDGCEEAMDGFARSARHWLVVASREHVERAVAGGFVQACHGKLRPLQRMRAGDGVVCYSPRERMDRVSPRVQSFVALGRLVDDRCYPFAMPDGRVPHRRDVDWRAVRPVALADLAPRLHLAAHPGWPMMLRRGHLELDAHDFELLAGAMLLDGRAAAQGARSGVVGSHQRWPLTRTGTSSSPPRSTRSSGV